MKWAMYMPDGRITRTVSMPDGMDPIALNGESFVAVGDEVNDLAHRVEGGVAVPIVKSIEQVRADKRAEINSTRLSANTYFTFAGKTIDSDDASRANIDSINGYVSLTGELPPSFPGIWKAQDNTFVPVPTVAEWTAMYGAMVARVQQNFARSEQLKSQLAAATTVQEIAAIAVTF